LLDLTSFLSFNNCNFYTLENVKPPACAMGKLSSSLSSAYRDYYRHIALPRASEELVWFRSKQNALGLPSRFSIALPRCLFDW